MTVVLAIVVMIHIIMIMTIITIIIIIIHSTDLLCLVGEIAFDGEQLQHIQQTRRGERVTFELKASVRFEDAPVDHVEKLMALALGEIRRECSGRSG